MEVDLSDAVVNVEKDTEPSQRTVQSPGRVDIPDGMLSSLGVSDGDTIMVMFNESENKVEIRRLQDVLDV
jgi:bifunctional DNA-binding transcriptional regulator/antitoxin component of YhaV-PrlF toxin-antitoxin module